MNNKQKTLVIQRILNNIYPKVPIPLNYKNTFTLLVSVLLSAQCTDVNVNNVTKNIYPKYNHPKHFVKLGRKDIDLIMNLQGDEPLMNIEDIQKLNKHMIQTKRDLGTLAAKINNKKVFENHDIVKVITEESLDDTKFPRAINFMRKLNKENNQAYHHLGIYCYNVEILKRFISFKQSQNEIENRLEQLRALDNNINVNVALAKSSPIGVDTKEDFMAIKKIMEYKS